ncbi:MAG: Rieske 2Fe-2S domain-containing protein [Candidatus Latescibacterota bacterium]|nr:MAG: Rieske 2Fe-2S domain-containing protein [Candidatus Latescibacterota bacterium]
MTRKKRKKIDPVKQDSRPSEASERLHETQRPQAIERSQERTTRRHFLWTLWIALGGVAVLEFVAVTVSFFRPRRSQADGDDGAVVVAGPMERFEINSVTAFPRGKFYLARLDGGGFLALSRECTHLGCTVPWDSGSQRFVCPCHASSFDITGGVLSPPAPRALDLHPVRIENGVVKVDTSRKIKRRSFDPGQVTYS